MKKKQSSRFTCFGSVAKLCVYKILKFPAIGGLAQMSEPCRRTDMSSDVSCLDILVTPDETPARPADGFEKSPACL